MARSLALVSSLVGIVETFVVDMMQSIESLSAPYRHRRNRVDLVETTGRGASSTGPVRAADTESKAVYESPAPDSWWYDRERAERMPGTR